MKNTHPLLPSTTPHPADVYQEDGFENEEREKLGMQIESTELALRVAEQQSGVANYKSVSLTVALGMVQSGRKGRSRRRVRDDATQKVRPAPSADAKLFDCCDARTRASNFLRVAVSSHASCSGGA